MHPSGISRSAVVLLLLAAAFYGLARSTGAGWVIVLLALVLGVLAVSAVWPALVVGRARLVIGTPRDATVGESLAVDVQVRAGGLVRFRLVSLGTEWIGADHSATGTLLAIPRARGVIGEVEVALRSAAPLGLFSWARRVTVTLAAPLEVGPAPSAVTLADVLPRSRHGVETSPRARVGQESFRSIREYQAGDRPRLVHWPATARWGDLMVKELENPEAPQLTLLVDVRGPAGEAAASRAAGLARAALAAGLPVTLLTAERGGPRAGPVTTAVEVGRRLARAVAAAPPDGPLPPGAVPVRVAGP